MIGPVENDSGPHIPGGQSHFEPILLDSTVPSHVAETTELETETRQPPEQAAQMLRDVADEISSGEDITVEGNNASITVPGTIDEIKTELEAEHEIKGEYDQVEIEVELEWTIVPDESAQG